MSKAEGESKRVPRDALTFEGADVTITYKLGNDTLTGKVCSQAMVMASPVWKRFIFPPWQQPTSPQTVDASRMETEDLDNAGSLTPASNLFEKRIDFTEDDGEALLIILNILHLKFKKVPMTISSTCILQLAKMCDQYQCTGSLQPWIQSWINAAKPKACNSLLREQWLFIYWAFGQENDFERIAKALVREVKIGEKGEYMTLEGEPLPEPTPHKIIESILVQRLLVIQKLLDAIYRWTSLLSQKTIDRQHICAYNDVECDSMIYGSLLFGLQDIELWPQVMPESIKLNVLELAIQIDKIPIMALPDVECIDYVKSHTGCRDKLKFERDVDSILDGNIENPVLDCHIIHMSTIRECL